MADIASRLNKGRIKEPTVTSPFQNIIIRNAQGIRIEYADIFSADKRREMNAYFNDKKRGTLARIQVIGGLTGEESSTRSSIPPHSRAPASGSSSLAVSPPKPKTTISEAE